MNTDLFSTASIRLRRFESDDLAWLQRHLNHPALVGRRNIPWGFPEHTPLSVGQVEAIFREWSENKKGINLGIEELGSGELLGHAGCDWDWDPHSPSLYLAVSPPEQRKTYGTQALQLLLGYLYGQTPAHNVSCWVAEWNQAARAFLTRHHFKEPGRLRRAGIYQGRYYDLIMMDILRQEWQRT